MTGSGVIGVHKYKKYKSLYIIQDKRTGFLKYDNHKANSNESGGR